VKASAAEVNGALGLLPLDLADAIMAAAEEVAAGRYDDQFPVDVFQTGSGTSTNMNANEVIASLASRRLGQTVHPNDHVNRGQSSNDVIPTTIHASAALALGPLKKALQALGEAVRQRASGLEGVIKTGRTHLMDAVPLTLGGWAAQLASALARIQGCEPRLLRLAQGGTAVGTGLNSDPAFAPRFAEALGRRTGLPFRAAENPFELIAAQDTAAELSGQLRVVALVLLKIANDLRWMNSGPLSGLGEIRLPRLQAGSSIMPGKVNPVIPEAVAMACTQVIGLDAAIALAAQDSRFQLNTMLPLIGTNLLEQIRLLTSSAQVLAEKAVARFEVNRDRLQARVARNPMLVTALTPLIGYDKSAEIARHAQEQGCTILEAARELTDIDEAELRTLLDPRRLTGR
jgi:fumarate hydratase class II